MRAGVAAYDDPKLLDVPAVEHNLADLAGILTNRWLGGFRPEHCVRASPRADVAEIGELLSSAAEEAEDLLLFYFSGHGMLGRCAGSCFYAWPEPGTTGWPSPRYRSTPSVTPA